MEAERKVEAVSEGQATARECHGYIGSMGPRDLALSLSGATLRPAAIPARGHLLRAFPVASAGTRPDFNHRTKTEHLATILLPNPVAAHDTTRDVMDGDAKIFKENKPQPNRPLRAEMTAAEFRSGGSQG